MSKKAERLAVFVFGVVFVVVMLVLSIAIPNPSPTQYETFKVVLALAAAGVAAFIPGFFEFTVPGWIRAGGALAVFVFVFYRSPATLVVDGPLSLSLGDATSNSGDVVLDFGRVVKTQALTATLDVENLSARERSVTVDAESGITATWTSGVEQTVAIPAQEHRRVSVKTDGSKAGGLIAFRESNKTLRTLKVAAEVVDNTTAVEKASGDKPSGDGYNYSVAYPICLGPAPNGYTLIKDSVRFWLTGDRRCGDWSHCDPVSADDKDVCYSFSLQGHSEGGGPRNSEGHLRAAYTLKAPEPRLRN
jgi:hypothetical protein